MKATATACHRLQVLWKEPENDDAVAVCHHGDTLDKSDQTRWPAQNRLNNKLRDRGLGEDRIRQILGGNAEALLRRIIP
jgi:hypothetical protein